MAYKTLHYIIYLLTQIQIFIVIKMFWNNMVLKQAHLNFTFGISTRACKNTDAMLQSSSRASLDFSDQRVLAAKLNWCGLKEFINSRCRELVSQFHKKSKSLRVTISTGHKLKPDCLCHLITCTKMPGFFFFS